MDRVCRSSSGIGRDEPSPFHRLPILPPLDRCVAIVLFTAPSLRSDRPPTFDNLSKALRGEAQMRRMVGMRDCLFLSWPHQSFGLYLCLFIVADTVDREVVHAPKK
jgi:hypothetical protein